MSSGLRKTSPAISREFARKTWNAAHRTAERYHIILNQEQGEWYGKGLEMPHVFADGKTPDRCLEKTREALAVAVAYLLESGKQPPQPASSGLRNAQVNVRLTSEEKALLEATAQRNGYSGLSDFIRAVALERTRQ